MKKIINGKIYNTKNAIELVCVSNNLGYSDFRNLTEGLFITKKGNFFVYGEGGAMTKYAIKEGNNKYWGNDIIAMDKEGVIKWLEENGKNISTEEIDVVMKVLSGELVEA